MNTKKALDILDNVTSRIVLIASQAGNVGLTREEHGAIVDALRALQSALSDQDSKSAE